jgi:ketosteroid isomerase-like protein
MAPAIRGSDGRSAPARDTAGAMSHDNVEIVREALDAYSRGDYDRVEGFHDPHIVVVTLEDGVVYGNDAVLANYKRWNEAWEAAETTLEEVIGRGDRVFVAVRFHGRGRASGVEVETLFYEVYMLRDGKVLRIDEYEERADALEAAGLSE